MNRLPFFVYGTLLPGQPNYDHWSHSIRDQKSAIFANGRLIDLGFYPILFEGGENPVLGKITFIRAEDYQQILNRLDELEGYDRNKPEAGLYRRVERQVNLDDNTRVSAWIYLGNPAMMTSGVIIDSGNWVTYSQGKKNELAAWWTDWRIGKIK